jgi:hypothetical protein
MTANQPDPARLTVLANAATKAATDASNAATCACTSNSHDRAAAAHRAAFEAHAKAYGANVQAGADENLIDTHRNQMIEHQRLAQHHDKESDELKLKRNGMESSAARLETISKRADWWSALANYKKNSQDDHALAAQAHSVAESLALELGQTHTRTQHASKKNFHNQRVAQLVALELNAGAKPSSCKWTDWNGSEGALTA